MHAAQDAETPDHYLKPWEGFGLNMETVTHVVDDIFPSLDTISNAYNSTLNVLYSRSASNTDLNPADWTDFNPMEWK